MAVLTWEPWEPGPAGGPNSPYAVWRKQAFDRSGDNNFVLTGKALFASQRVYNPAFLAATRTGGGDGGRDGDGDGDFRAFHDATKAEFGEVVPIWSQADNPNWEAGAATTPADKLPSIEPDSVIVVVIDSGVPLHHTRTRNGDKTRILAAWQQNGRRAKDPETDAFTQPYLPFGRELYRDEIDDLLNTCKIGDQIDAQAFNQKAGLTEVNTRQGARELLRRVSHGAAVLDMAVGAPQTGSPDLDPKQVHIIVVNLPDRTTMGLSGEFLDYFTAFALQRAVNLADAIWDKSHAGWDDQDRERVGDRNGFPVVVSLAFGKNAGQKDGTDVFNTTVSTIRAKRDPLRNPVHVVVPVGNDNLAQGTAVLDLAPGGSDSLGWQLSPEDQSNNYLELWTSPTPQTIGATTLPSLQVSVRAPGGAAPVAGGTPAIDQVQYLRKVDGGSKDNVAGLFLRRWPVPGQPTQALLQYVLCTLPTLNQSDPDRVAPAGLWEITVTNKSDQRVMVDLMVQTDQSELPDGRSSRMSRLVDPHNHYSTHSDTGRRIDSYSYPFDGPPKDQDRGSRVQRHGSMNATATSPDIVATTGHREIDGRPADYASTGKRREPSWLRPLLSLPIEDGVFHPGQMVSGAQDGTVARLGGTSFATARAARRIAVQIAADLGKSGTGTPFSTPDIAAWARQLALQDDPGLPDDLPAAKVGSGRLGRGRTDRLDRLDTSRTNWGVRRP